MLYTICKSKLHGATVTDAHIEYEGSLTLDTMLMQAARIHPYEQVHVVDVTNGARLITYCIEGPAGSGTVCINGAAARLVSIGDRVIIIAYAQLSPQEMETFHPTVVMLGKMNRIGKVRSSGNLAYRKQRALTLKIPLNRHSRTTAGLQVPGAMRMFKRS